jgi:hypothetical protein
MNKHFITLFFVFSFCNAFVLSQNFDINLLKSINKNESNFKNEYSHFNSSAVSPLAIGIPAAIAIAGFAKHNKQLQRDALYMGGSFVLTTIITQATKRIVNRQRPFAAYSFIVKREDAEERLSFPSGHTSPVWPGHVCTRACITQVMYLPVPLLVQAAHGWVIKYSYGWKKGVKQIP